MGKFITRETSSRQPQRLTSSINKANTRSLPGANIGSDHHLVLTTIRSKLKTKRFKKSSGIRFDLEKLKAPKIAAYGMEVSTEKSKIMTNSMNSISADISTNGQKLEEVACFKYLEAIRYKHSTCSAEVRIRIASATAAVAVMAD